MASYDRFLGAKVYIDSLLVFVGAGNILPNIQTKPMRGPLSDSRIISGMRCPTLGVVQSFES